MKAILKQFSYPMAWRHSDLSRLHSVRDGKMPVLVHCALDDVSRFDTAKNDGQSFLDV